MKYFLLILLMVNMLLAIEQVPRRSSTAETKESEIGIEAKQSATNSDARKNEVRERTIVQEKEKQRDLFIDNNSNGVNDRREDDFQSIKTKKSKHKDKIDRQKVDRVEPKQKEKTSTSTREKTTSKEKQK
jgi:hypothetical protein